MIPSGAHTHTKKKQPRLLSLSPVIQILSFPDQRFGKSKFPFSHLGPINCHFYLVLNRARIDRNEKYIN